MAKQRGSNPLTGPMDDYSYYFHKDYGFLVRRKGGPSRNQLKKGSHFDIPRRNNSEFGRASNYGRLVRVGFRVFSRYCKDGSMNTRLCCRVLELVKMDKESEFGKRDLRTDSLAAFTHFEWDKQCLSSKFFELPVETNCRKGNLEVTAGISLGSKPRGASAWKLYSIAATIDFRGKTVKADEQESDLYEFEKGDFAESFTHYYTEQGVLFHGMCIAWYAYDAKIDDYVPLKQDHVNAGFVRYVAQ
jgi:hypothetical protein